MLLSGDGSGEGDEAVPDEDEAAGVGAGALFASGSAAVSVSCAKRSLKPARKLMTCRGQVAVVGAPARGDRGVEQPAVERERDRHREGSADQRP